MTDTEFEAIKARHEHCNFTVTKTEWNEREAFNAHTDRATLLALLDAARAKLAEINVWTDDDQRGLTAAVADAMWYWDDMPMDCDDAISLTSILKNSLRDNGFQIVRLAAAVENKKK